MTSTDWMHDNGAPLLPKVSPYCIPMKMMELKRRPTLYDIRGSGWQLRHKKATPGEEVPWERVFHWPPKQIHVITNQELFKPGKQRKKRVVKKGAKVVKAPPTPVREKKFVAKFIVRYDFQRVLNYLDKRVGGAQADKRARVAASADATTAATTAPTARKIFSRPLVPGAFPDDDAAAADVDAQTQSAADDQAQPSLLAAIFSFAFGLFFGRSASKRAHEDDAENETGDAKRRRVGSDAQAPARAEARPVAGKATRTKTTGAPAPKHHNFTANAASPTFHSFVADLALQCPPPTRNAPVAGNAKVVEALSMLPPLAPAARPIAGRPTRKRADTPDPRVGTPPPSEPEASSAVSTPTSSLSSSRSSSPASSRSPSPSPSPAPKSKSSKSKSSSSKSKSSSESSSKSKSTSSKSTSSSSESSSSKSKSPPSESKSSSKSQPSAPESKSTSSKSTSSIRPWHTKKPMAERSSLELAMDPSTVSGSTAIMLLPPNIRWSRDGELVNPWDPRCPAAPDPVYPWAPACEAWVNARAAPIAPLPEAPSAPSFVRPTRRPAASTSTSAPHRAGSLARGGFSISSGEETEVESGGKETDDEE